MSDNPLFADFEDERRWLVGAINALQAEIDRLRAENRRLRRGDLSAEATDDAPLDEVTASGNLFDALEAYIEYYEHAEYGQPSDNVREWIADAIMGLHDDDDVKAAVRDWLRTQDRG